MNFLVVDDDQTFREATCFLIEEAGHYAEGAANGPAGVAVLKEEKFDAVLLDLNLGAGKRPGPAGGNAKAISANSRGHVHRGGQRENRSGSHAARRG
jgi:CheY-like chemotaxis protein